MEFPAYLILLIQTRPQTANKLLSHPILQRNVHIVCKQIVYLMLNRIVVIEFHLRYADSVGRTVSCRQSD